FTSLGALLSMPLMTETTTFSLRPSAFRMDRYALPSTAGIPLVPMASHRVWGGDPLTGSNGPAGSGREISRYFSPDYRYRSDQFAVGYAPNLAPNAPAAPGEAGVPADSATSGGIRGRDIYLARMANMLTTRSDVYTAYIALIDEDGNY